MSILIVLGLFLVGIIVGRMLLGKPKIHHICNRLMMWAVYVLLFFLGISVGSDAAIIDNIPTLGFQALVLALAALTGSLVTIRLVTLAFKRWM
ncbi:LysO family transporter [Alkaliflexus imshenetskii]|uniref:LysO family transporter n=1 Tax=Alkaliflexus imshenetskii TaxID=286730 RepID=UPI0006949DB0|nr:LysO family transporter [Alkaliflexus imshenetskii]